MTTPIRSLPLVVDLDGTLVIGDTLWEACVKLVAHKPWLALLMPFWLLKGKAAFKARVSEHVSLAAQTLIYQDVLLDYLAQVRQQGRSLWLASATNENIARAVAGHLDIFDGVFASDAQHNLSGKRKAQALVAKFGDKGFIYAGNAAIDLQVWQHAAGAIVVNASPSLARAAGSITEVETVIPAPGTPGLFNRLVRAMRVYQWVKNLLVFAALILSHSIGRPDLVLLSVLAFFSFSFAASSIYIINDLVDLDADRIHHLKRHRVFASGALPLYWGAILVPLLLLVSLMMAYHINPLFLAAVLAYVFITIAYSFFLKRFALLDVFSLTSLYTLRIIAGALAIGVVVSYWLLAFSMFIFLSLALAKRYIELYNLRAQADSRQAARGYHIDDLPVVGLFGISSGYLAVMVTVLYIHDLQADVLYTQPAWLWAVALAILYWITRMWLLAYRGELHEDPVLFAIHDRPSYLIMLVCAIALFMAL